MGAAAASESGETSASLPQRFHGRLCAGATDLPPSFRKAGHQSPTRGHSRKQSEAQPPGSAQRSLSPEELAGFSQDWSIKYSRTDVMKASAPGQTHSWRQIPKVAVAGGGSAADGSFSRVPGSINTEDREHKGCCCGHMPLRSKGWQSCPSGGSYQFPHWPRPSHRVTSNRAIKYKRQVSFSSGEMENTMLISCDIY